MKKIIIGLLILMVVLFLPIGESKIADSYKHKSDNYAVTFDGEGDAIVSANIQLENTMESGSVEIVTLNIPKHIILYSIWQEQGGRSKRIDRNHIFEKEFEDSTSLNIVLPYAVKKTEQSSITLTYKIPGYAKKNLFGIYNFDFETIIDDEADLIDDVRVAVNVVPDLYIKDSGSEIRYKPDYSAMEIQNRLAVDKSAAISLSEYNRVIKESRGYIKKSSYLDPGESFHINGKYAKSWFSLNFIKFIFILIIICGLIFGAIKLYKRRPRNKTIINRVFEVNYYSWIKAIIVGASSGLILMLLILGSVVLVAFLESTLDYGYRFLVPIFILMIVLLSFILLFVPSIYIGIKQRSLLIGILTFISTMVLFVLVLICLAIFMNKGYLPPSLFFAFSY